MKALFENVGSSMCSDHCDWFGNSGLEAMSRNADTLPVIHFLQLRPTNYEIKKLQLSDVTGIIKKLILFQMITCTTMLIHGHSDSAFGHYQQEMRIILRT